MAKEGVLDLENAVEAPDVTANDGMIDIDAKLEQAAEKVFGKPGQETETEEMPVQGETNGSGEAVQSGGQEGAAQSPELSSLTADELTAAEAANLSATEIQRLQSLTPEARSATLEMLATRSKPVANDPASVPGWNEEDLSKTVNSLIRPVGKDVLSKFAASIPGANADDAAISNFAEEIQRASAEPLAKLTLGLLGLIRVQSETTIKNEIGHAARYLKADLVKQYPELSKGEAFTRLVASPHTRKAVEVYQGQGLDLGTAAERAIKDRVAADYGSRNSAKAAAPNATRQASLRATPAPGENTRQGTVTTIKTKPGQAPDLDAILDAAFDVVEKQKKK